MNIISVDWGSKQGKLVAVFRNTNGELQCIFPKDLESIIKDNPNSKILIETSFSSYKRDQDKYVDLASSVGTEIWKFPTRHTERWRRKLGIPKSDTGDANLFLYLWENKLGSFSKAKKPICDKFTEEIQSLLKDELVELRIDKYSKGNLSKKYEKYIPDVLSLPEDVRTMLADRRNTKKVSYDYNETILYTALAAAVGVVENSGNRKDYDRIISITCWKNPSVFRSNIYHHRLHTLLCKSLGLRGNSSQEVIQTIDEEIRVKKHKELTRQMRKAFRYIFYHVKSVYNKGKLHSEMDTVDPTL